MNVPQFSLFLNQTVPRFKFKFVLILVSFNLFVIFNFSNESMNESQQNFSNCLFFITAFQNSNPVDAS